MVKRLQTGLLDLTPVLGCCVPVLYFGTQVIAGLSTPRYSWLHHTASDLGSDGQPHASFVNFGAILAGLSCLLFGLGVTVHSRRRSVGWGVIVPAMASLLGIGLSHLNAGLFPMPSSLHSGPMVLLPLMLAAPVTIGLLIWHTAQGRSARIYVAGNTVAFAALFVIVMRAQGIDQLQYPGLGQRLLAINVFIPIAVLGLTHPVRSSSRSTDQPSEVAVSIRNGSTSTEPSVASRKK